MELVDLLAELRRDLDDTAEPYLWSDADLTAYLNQAVEEVCERTRCLTDAVTASVCTLALEADQPRYTLNAGVIAVRRARLTGERDSLSRVSLRTLDAEVPGWDDSTLVGTNTPRYVAFDVGDGSLVVHPTPDDDYTLNLTVWRRPLELERLEGPSDEPVVPEQYHRHLRLYALHRAWSVRDTEKYDAERSADALADFTAQVGEKPTLHAMRLWSVAPQRKVKAHFD